MNDFWKVDRIVQVINQLAERGHSGIPNLMTYVVVPYTASAGHNPYDFESADIQLSEGYVVVKVAKDLSLVISLTNDFPFEPDRRMFLHLDEVSKTMTLYFKVLNGWERVSELDMTSPNAAAEYKQIAKYVVRDRLMSEYQQKGNRMLTENVVNRQLDAGDWENEFVRNAVIEEIKNPSPEFISAIVNRLSDTYTTKEKPWITERLEPIHNAGLEGMVTKIVNEGLIDERSKYSYIPKPKDEPKQEVEKPKAEEKPKEKEVEAVKETVEEVVDNKPAPEKESSYYNSTKGTETGGTVNLSDVIGAK
ncbi:hypothetical protein FT641_17920 [Bacillus paranthracis]|uniref:hypothetical protein n=1 Tax=Bacillus paranthracis TaxID=2026186 RepID=UPI00187973E1|nr:hypothetical protein [Bacillus paranthracis]MBE7114561.1 hypothetical protein [Bacillus paranthracis]MBE7154565.1 hypothetical protein [Bacillus paranthracis]